MKAFSMLLFSVKMSAWPDWDGVTSGFVKNRFYFSGLNTGSSLKQSYHEFVFKDSDQLILIGFLAVEVIWVLALFNHLIGVELRESDHVLQEHCGKEILLHD